MEAVVTVKMTPHELELIVESLVNYHALRKEAYAEVPLNERSKWSEKNSELMALLEKLT